MPSAAERRAQQIAEAVARLGGGRSGGVRDLARLVSAAGESATKADLALCVRALCERLGLLSPGRTVELRVPPYAAVQLGTGDGTGPRHTRGTPPTVVETDPLTFCRLAAGDITWSEAAETHALSLSGIHADLSHLFPV